MGNRSWAAGWYGCGYSCWVECVSGHLLLFFGNMWRHDVTASKLVFWWLSCWVEGVSGHHLLFFGNMWRHDVTASKLVFWWLSCWVEGVSGHHLLFFGNMWRHDVTASKLVFWWLSCWVEGVSGKVPGNDVHPFIQKDMWEIISLMERARSPVLMQTLMTRLWCLIYHLSSFPWQLSLFTNTVGDSLNH